MALTPEQAAFAQNWLANEARGGGSSDSPGIGSHVLDILGLFDRPRNALATGVQEGLSDDPSQSFLGGLGRGITGEKQTSWGDVVGLDPATSEMGWPEWLARSGGRLAMDVVADPLNLAFAPAKAAGGLGKGISTIFPFLKEGQSLAGAGAAAAHLPQAADWVGQATGLNKAFNPKTGDAAKDLAWAAQGRKGAESQQLIRQEIEKIIAMEGEAGITPERLLDIAHGIERPGQLARDLRPDVVGTDILGAYEPLLQKQEALLKHVNDLVDWHHEASGGLAAGEKAKTIPNLTDDAYRYMTHPRANVPYAESGRLGDPRIDAFSTTNPSHRTLGKWEYKPDETAGIQAGTEVKPGFISDMKSKHLAEAGIVKDSTGKWVEKGTGLEVEFNPRVSMKEIIDSGVMKAEDFVVDPKVAIPKSIEYLQKRANYLEFMKQAREQGWTKNIEDIGFLGPHARELNIQGFKGTGAEGKFADFLENQARMSGYDPSTPMGAIGEALAPIFKSKIGETFDSAMQWWKRNVLAHPGFIAGNIGSNIAMMATHGDVAPWRLLPQVYNAAKVLFEKGADVLGVEPSYFKKEFATRNIDIKRGAGQYGAEEVGKVAKEGFLRKTLPEPLGFIATGAEAYGKHINDNVFKVSNWLEQNNKMAVALDWLRKEAPDFATKAPEEKAKLLDQAAQHAHDALINYDATTPFRKEVLQKIFPFERWAVGMTGATVDTALNKPQNLANLGRAYDTIFEPMSERDKSISDAWIQENAPTQGIFGKTYDQWMADLGQEPNPQGKRTFMAGRFIPQQNLEGAFNRPLDTLMSMVNPLLKTPYELLANRNTFKDRPLDTIAGGGLQSLVNPIIGKPYELAGQTTFGVELPAGYQYLLGQSPLGRTTNELSTAGRGIGFGSDPYKAEMGPGETLAWLLTGGKVMPWDEVKQTQHRGYEFTSKLRDIKSKMTYAIKKGNTEGAQFYQDQYAKHLQSRPAQMGYGEPGL